MPICAQLDNSVFLRPLSVDTTKEDKVLEMRISNLSYLKNNEYFNKIHQGYTLFGNLNYFTLGGQPHPNFRLEGGIFLRQDFGNSGFQVVQPVLSAIYQKNNHKVIFGNLEAHLHHGYIEPLMNFENLILHPNESGLQYKYLGANTLLNVWVDWLEAIYPGDTIQEQIRAGIQAVQYLAKSDTWEIKVPIQTIWYHKGGQLSPQPLPIMNHFNGSLGIDLRYVIPSNKNYVLQLDGYYCYSLDFSSQQTWFFSQGQGLFINLGFKNPYIPLLFSLWRGNQFTTLHGGRLYPSNSDSIRFAEYFELRRDLLFLRMIKDISLNEELKISIRLEPFYDFNSKAIEHSFGFYLIYDGFVQVGKSKRNAF